MEVVERARTLSDDVAAASESHLIARSFLASCYLRLTLIRVSIELFA